MPTESQVDKSLLKNVIQEEFGIGIATMTPILKVGATRGYVIGSLDHRQFFLKIYPNDKVPNASFRFAYDLFGRVGIENIVHPIAADSGQMRIQIGEFHVALFNFVAGKTAEENRMDNSQLEKLGELLAKIHQSKKVIGEYSVRENFEIAFKDKFIAIFEHIHPLPARPGEYKQKLGVLLEPHTEKFMQELGTLEELQRKVRKMDLEFFNCHGEPSPGNVLASHKGEIYLLDWDEPIFAPKEKDLLFFKDNSQPVMKGYRRFSEDSSLNRDVIEFYGHMWNLGEIVDYGSRILFENNSDVQNQTWLGNLKGGWDFVF